MVDPVRSSRHQGIIRLAKEGVGLVQHFVMIFFGSSLHGKFHLKGPAVNLPIPHRITAMGKGSGLELAPEGIAAAVRQAPVDRELVFHPVFGDGKILFVFFSFRKHALSPPGSHYRFYQLLES